MGSFTLEHLRNECSTALRIMESSEIKIRQIGMFPAIALVVGSIVGTGIFVTPSMIAQFTLDPIQIGLLWLVGSLLCLIGGDLYGRLGQKFPVGGGQYVYLLESMGRPVALVYGYMSFLVLAPTMIAGFSMFLGEQVQMFFPSLGAQYIQIIALSFLALITLINCLGIQTTGGVEKWIVTTQIVLILALFVGLELAAGERFTALGAEASDPSLKAAALALVGILWSFEGFNCLSFVAHEVRNARHKLRLYVLLGCLIVFILYLLLNYLAFTFLSKDQLLQSPNIALPLAELAFGSYGRTLTGTVMIVAVFMTSIPAVLIGPRVTCEMANEGWMPRFLSKLHPRSTSPNNAILAQFVLASGFVFLGSFEWLITCFITVSWVFYILVGIGFWRLEKRKSWIDRAEVVLFIVLAFMVVAMQVRSEPSLSLKGFIMAGLGYLAAQYFNRRTRSSNAKLKS